MPYSVSYLYAVVLLRFSNSPFDVTTNATSLGL